MTSTRKSLVTCALLYANGPLHLGHLMEHIQADIWVRFQRLRGHDCLFIGGEDAHGTPIMLSAQKQGISPETLIQRVFIEHRQDLRDFGISFDHFYTTHTPENEQLVQVIYQKLKEKGHVITRIIQQAYDSSANLFLPDRYVKGTCPHCDTSEQYGDNCEACGAVYDALALKDPVSVISGTPPISKASEQYFFKLSEYQSFLYDWVQTAIPEQARAKLLEWFKVGLQDLAISREAPYFGFKIPGTENKYFYVWMDAPIGYMAIFKHLCQENAELNFDEYWIEPDKVNIYQVIGKDIVNFHALFWPAFLKGSDFRLPTRLFIHGYLTIEGMKMSKSRGTFITARDYLNHFSPEVLRYYLASKMSSTIEDIDFSGADFIQKVNADLVGKVVNIASRCAKIINQYFDHQLSQQLDSIELLDQFIGMSDEIALCFEQRNYHHAVRHIMGLADLTNQYLESKKPWVLIRNEKTKSLAQQVCTTGLNLFQILMIYLKPIVPTLCTQAEAFLGIPSLSWADLTQILTGKTIQTYHPLLTRISMETLQKIMPLKTENSLNSKKEK